MTYLEEQMFRATQVNPQGTIVPSWNSFLERVAEQDDARQGGLSNTGTLLVRDTDGHPFSLRKALVGILP